MPRLIVRAPLSHPVPCASDSPTLPLDVRHMARYGRGMNTKKMNKRIGPNDHEARRGALGDFSPCDGRHTDGWYCTLKPGHEGEHVASTPSGYIPARWES